MKKACLLLVLLTSLIACEKADPNEPRPEPVKKINATSSAGNYAVNLTYAGNRLTDYVASNGTSFKFTYNSDGLPSIIEETIGGVKTEYTIHYNGITPEWSSTRVNQNNVWTNGPDYEYTVVNGNVTELAQFVKGSQIQTGSVKAEYDRHFLTKATSTIIGNQWIKTYTYSKGSISTEKRINLLTVNMPAHLVSLFVADKEVNGNITTSFTYE